MFIVAILNSYQIGRHYGFIVFTRDSQTKVDYKLLIIPIKSHLTKF